MTEARFLIDSFGEATQNPRFDGCMLDVAGAAQLGIETERIETARMAVRESRVLLRAQVRMAKGLLLEPAPWDKSESDDALADLPTEEFETVAAESDDPQRMDLLRSQRRERKQGGRKDDIKDGQRMQMRIEEARQRLEGRRPPSGGRGRRTGR